MNKKTVTGWQIINWGGHTNTHLRINGSTAFIGYSGAGKTQLLDAFTFLLTGNRKFNQSAENTGRSVTSYLKGDTRAEGSHRYLRGNQAVVSYIAMEVYSTETDTYMVAFVCSEMNADSVRATSSWYVAQDTKLSDIHFGEYLTVNGEQRFKVYPKDQLVIHGERLKNRDFMGLEKGTQQLIQALGLRCKVSEYQSRIQKLMAYKPEKNIDTFIRECLFEPKTLSSVKDIKEYRENLEKMRKYYEGQLQCKAAMERAEKAAEIYETTHDEYHKRRLVLQYQKWQTAKEDVAKLKEAKKQETALLQQYKQKAKRKAQAVDAARKALEKINNSTDYQDFTSRVSACEQRIEHLQEKQSFLEAPISKLTELQQWIMQIVGAGAVSLDPGVVSELRTLASPGNIEKKTEAFTRFSSAVYTLQEQKRDELSILRNDAVKDKTKLSELRNLQNSLKQNRLVFDNDLERARAHLQAELLKEGIHTDIRFFVELVSGIKDKRWRRAIETFLGGKRFNMIVEPKYCRKAMEILNNSPSLKSKLVVTDKLTTNAVVSGSAAEQLEIANAHARAYANYLLNGLILCDTLDELHEHPRGGIMANGMFAKSYVTGKLDDMDRVKLFIGQDAIKIQLAETEAEITALVAKMENDRLTAEKTKKELIFLEINSINAGEYQFNAPNENEELARQIKDERVILNGYKKNPSYAKVVEEQQKAADKYNKAVEENNDAVGQYKVCESKIEEMNMQCETLAAKVEEEKDTFKQECEKMPHLEEPAIQMYQQSISGSGKTVAITEKTIKNWFTDLDKARKGVEQAHLEICRVNGQMSEPKYGLSYIAYYRDEYRSLVNTKIDELLQAMDQTETILKKSLLNDLVGELSESMEKAEEEKNKINQELRHRPFGNDIYNFEIKENRDTEGRFLFFKIRDQMRSYMDNPEMYLNSISDNEEAKADIQRFAEIILHEEDETEYSDYRKYFTYNLVITQSLKDGNKTTLFSNKVDSASGGEMQTPFILILAASLIHLYPDDRVSTRLAFIDEAYDHMSADRIAQMVDFLESNNIQVFYSTPAEGKAETIGALIPTTIGIVKKKGTEYCYPVEGIKFTSDEDDEDETA